MAPHIAAEEIGQPFEATPVISRGETERFWCVRGVKSGSIKFTESFRRPPGSNRREGMVPESLE
jgi:hypothetical protein